MNPSERELALISSITSTNFRKVIFSPDVSGFLLDERYWLPFDDTICGLVDRLRASGNKHTLEVELRVRIEEFGGEGYQAWFFPKFKEKGRVRIVAVPSGRVREWP